MLFLASKSRVWCSPFRSKLALMTSLDPQRPIRSNVLSRWPVCVRAVAKHLPDLISCQEQAAVAIWRLCEKCHVKCVICDSYVCPWTPMCVCDECNYDSCQGHCVICGGPGASDTYYCKECTIHEKDRDGCPQTVNLGSSETDLSCECKKYGLRKMWQGGSLFLPPSCHSSQKRRLLLPAQQDWSTEPHPSAW